MPDKLLRNTSVFYNSILLIIIINNLSILNLSVKVFWNIDIG